MKLKLVLILVLGLLLVGCSAETEDAQAQQPQAPTTPDVPETPPVDEEIIEDETLQEYLDTIDEDIEEQIRMQEELEALAGTVPIQEWCIPGEVFQYQDSGSSVQSNIVGITTRDGQTVCQAVQTQSTQGIDIRTTYFISESQKEIWLEIDAMGQVTESYVNLN